MWNFLAKEILNGLHVFYWTGGYGEYTTAACRMKIMEWKRAAQANPIRTISTAPRQHDLANGEKTKTITWSDILQKQARLKRKPDKMSNERARFGMIQPLIAMKRIKPETNVGQGDLQWSSCWFFTRTLRSRWNGISQSGSNTELPVLHPWRRYQFIWLTQKYTLERVFEEGISLSIWNSSSTNYIYIYLCVRHYLSWYCLFLLHDIVKRHPIGNLQNELTSRYQEDVDQKHWRGDHGFKIYKGLNISQRRTLGSAIRFR